VYRYPVPDDVPVHLVRKTRPWHLPAAILGMRRLVEELNPDLVFSQLHYVNMVAGTALALRNRATPWVCRQCNDPRFDMRGPFLWWARWALRQTDCLIALSQGVARATADYLRLDPARVVTIYNMAEAVEIDRLSREALPFPRPANTFVVIHAGRLHRQKNQALLLRAFSRFRGRPAELWVLGDGPLRRRLGTLATRLGIAGQVRWLGFQANPFPYLRAADCFALSSDAEGLGNVLIESMLCGTPPVATRCPYGPDEVLRHGETGLLVPVGDANAFARALEQLAADAGLRERMGTAARRSAIERFDAARQCAKFEEIFVQAARRGEGAGAL